jgi:hypothetical protein
MADEIERLVRWYRAQCNGDRKRPSGIQLSCLDVQGWALDANLSDPSAAGKVVEIRIERDEDDWISYEGRAGVFRGRCGPGNLEEMLGAFLDFAEV